MRILRERAFMSKLEANCFLLCCVGLGALTGYLVSL